MKLSLFFLSAAAMVSAATATAPVNLGTAVNYAILTKTGIDTVPTSSITGDIGVSPIAATAITGFSLVLDSAGQYATSSQITGTAKAASYGGAIATALTTAVSDMETAYADAASRPSTDDTNRYNMESGEIGGETLGPGVYTFTQDVSINSDLTLDGDDIFIIKTTESFLQAAGIQVILVGGARAENIFWQVAGAVTVEAGAILHGVVLVKQDAFFKTESILNGRVLAQTACNIQQATIVQP
jgi:hypothetical protein